MVMKVKGELPMLSIGVVAQTTTIRDFCQPSSSVKKCAINNFLWKLPKHVHKNKFLIFIDFFNTLKSMRR